MSRSWVDGSQAEIDMPSGSVGPSVLFVSYTASRTGPTISLAATLSKLTAAYDIGVAVPGEGRAADAFREAGVRVHTFPALTKWYVLRLARLIRRWPYQLVYANNTSGSSRNAAIAAMIARRPFACHVRGVLEQPSWTQFWYLRTASGVVAVSRAAAGPVERFVRSGNLHVVYNGVPDDFVRDVRSRDGIAVRKTLGLSEEATVLTTLAHVKPAKGHHHALEALELVRREMSDVHLLIAGAQNRNREYVEWLKEEISRRGLEDGIHLLGFRSDVAAILAATDVYLHPSLSEAHPRAVLEAMAVGLPVVAFGVGGITETVKHGVTGILVSPEDHVGLANGILRILREREWAQKMGSAGASRVARRFSASATADAMRRVIDRMLGETRPDRAFVKTHS